MSKLDIESSVLSNDFKFRRSRYVLRHRFQWMMPCCGCGRGKKTTDLVSHRGKNTSLRALISSLGVPRPLGVLLRRLWDNQGALNLQWGQSSKIPPSFMPKPMGFDSASTFPTALPWLGPGPAATHLGVKDAAQKSVNFEFYSLQGSYCSSKPVFWAQSVQRPVEKEDFIPALLLVSGWEINGYSWAG